MAANDQNQKIYDPEYVYEHVETAGEALLKFVKDHKVMTAVVVGGIFYFGYMTGKNQATNDIFLRALDNAQ